MIFCFTSLNRLLDLGTTQKWNVTVTNAQKCEVALELGEEVKVGRILKCMIGKARIVVKGRLKAIVVRTPEETGRTVDKASTFLVST